MVQYNYLTQGTSKETKDLCSLNCQLSKLLVSWLWYLDE